MVSEAAEEHLPPAVLAAVPSPELTTAVAEYAASSSAEVTAELSPCQRSTVRLVRHSLDTAVEHYRLMAIEIHRLHPLC